MYRLFSVFLVVVMLSSAAIPTIAQEDHCTQDEATEALAIIEDRELLETYDLLQESIRRVSEESSFSEMLFLYTTGVSIYNYWRNDFQPTMPDCYEANQFALNYNVAFTDRLLQMGLVAAAFDHLDDDETLDTILEEAGRIEGDRIDENVINMVVWSAALQNLRDGE